MNRLLWLGAVFCGCQIGSMVAFAAGGVDDIARPGKPVIVDLAGYPEGTPTLLNHVLRADGWRPWFTEWPNDVVFFSFDAKSPEDVQAIVDAFAAIKANGKQIRLSAMQEPVNLGWVSRIPEGRKMSVLFTMGDQSTIDAWHKRVRKPFGQIEFSDAPVAVPPTLTIFVGNPSVKLQELRIPLGIEVLHGNVPGTFHRWNDKAADIAAAQIPVGPAEMKQVSEINDYLNQQTEAVPKTPQEKPVQKIESVPRERLLDYPILWDEECLLSYDSFGLRVRAEFSDRIVFYYGQPGQKASEGQPILAAMVDIPLRDGKPHGKVRRWAEDGTLLVEIPYRAGQIDGECRFYNRQGKLLGTSTIKQGKGTYRIWDRSQASPVLVREIEYPGETNPTPAK